jgi:preprotein translocase subunit SecB
MKMTENFKILAEFIKDISSETPNVQTYIFTKENISKYILSIDIHSNAMRRNMVEINTIMKFEDKQLNEKKSYFEINYTTIAKINDEIKVKKELEKIILVEIQKNIYPRLEKAFINLLHDSGHPEVNLEKKIDFDTLYKEKFN